MTNAWTLLEGSALPRASSFASLSAFARLGLDADLDIESASLEKNYIDLSKRLHPDFHTSKGPREMTRAIALTASLNQAYGILKDPVQRSEHLLKELGGPSPADDKRTPGNFLMDMLELRETYEEHREAKNLEAIQAMLNDLEPQRAKAMDTIRAAFEKHKQGSELDVNSIREQLNTLKYYDNLIQELKEALGID
ncbi:MAG: Fe-S protein assembly co-chaperone HscB [Planctomycetota bacterium]|nr:Fe-S protein assembly co-chaperone HscB [Planctomycetota bacterium]